MVSRASGRLRFAVTGGGRAAFTARLFTSLSFEFSREIKQCRLFFSCMNMSPTETDAESSHFIYGSYKFPNKKKRFPKLT